MNDSTAVPCEAEVLPVRAAPGLLADARSVISGLLFTAVVTCVGAALVALALVVGVVGSPLIAAAIAWVILRERRVQRIRALAAGPVVP